MIKISGLVFIGFSILVGTLLFETSQSVQRVEGDLNLVESKISAEENSLNVLTVEWDYLNRPERLEKLTIENLDIDQKASEKSNFIDANADMPELDVPIKPSVKPSIVLQRVSIEQDKGDN